jgi:receptor expression-enhancing protein 5/6
MSGNKKQQNPRGGGAPTALDKFKQNPLVIRGTEKVNLYKIQLEKWLKSDENALASYLALAEKKTGVDRVYLFGGALGLITLYLLFGWNAGLLSHLITFLYPAYASLHALETRNKDDDTKWLTYWVVFGFLGHLEFLGEYVLAVLPFYYLFKTGFQVWLFLGGGSLIIYNRVLRPFAVRFLHVDQGSVKGQINSAKDKLERGIDKAQSYVKETETRVRQEINDKLD